MENNKKILFICRHNMFRSRVAEEYMKKISDFNISSAGLIKCDFPSPINQFNAAKEFNLDIPAYLVTLDQLSDFIWMEAQATGYILKENATEGINDALDKHPST